MGKKGGGRGQYVTAIHFKSHLSNETIPVSANLQGFTLDAIIMAIRGDEYLDSKSSWTRKHLDSKHME